MSLKKSLGQSKILRPFRRKLIYAKQGFKTAKVHVNRNYLAHKVEFDIIASLKTASKIKYIGVENTLLLNSFKLAQKYKSNKTDLVVLDIGSNFGYLGAVWADSIAKDGEVLAFEPNRELFKCIETTIQKNKKFKTNFKVNNLAVGDKNEKIDLNVTAFSSNANSMSDQIDSYAVTMVKIDDFVKENKSSPIDLIKIDVDGIELNILNGAEDVIRRDAPIVIVETNNDKRIIEFFNKLEYNILDMTLSPFHGPELPVNIFCVPK